MSNHLNYKEINILEFDYPLPNERIAKYPLEKRNTSKLLIYNNQNISTSSFSSIVNQLYTDDLLVFNNTKVIQARLHFKKATGATIEVFLLNPHVPEDYQQAFSSTSETQWNCVIGNLKRWKGETLNIDIPELKTTLSAQFIRRTDDGALVNFIWNNSEIYFSQIIEACGKVPIPPYLNRDPMEEDKSRYQTVYAKPEGSVAAPTAGLHFTQSILGSLAEKGINASEVTLHVGAGTFKPVKSQTIGEHEMHTEQLYVPKSLVDNLINCKGKVVSVGTTSMRTLESLHWLGVKLITEKKFTQNTIIEQWDGYNLNQEISALESLSAISQYMKSSRIDHISAKTRMIIVPGYSFRIVDVLITNFHQPRSTLLLLVAAFIGDDWRKVYQYAIENGFRFLSYGDSSILFKKRK